MELEKGCGIGAEYPHSHLIQLLFIILFTLVWIIDGLFFQFSIQFGIFPLDFLRIFLFLILLVLSYFLIKSSGFIISEEIIKEGNLIQTGIYARIRHPMYLGIIFIYLAFVILSLSLINLIALLLIFIIMNHMSNYEDKALERIYGSHFKEYKKSVGKWFPRLFTQIFKKTTN